MPFQVLPSTRCVDMIHSCLIWSSLNHAGAAVDMACSFIKHLLSLGESRQ